MRVVLDTCVWVAAVRSRRGAGYALLSELPYGRFSFGISVALFLEYESQLLETAREGAATLTIPQTEAVLAALAHFGREVPTYFKIRPGLRDESDNMVFECAVNFGASAIVTHNVRDFVGSEVETYGIRIVKPGEFLENLRRSI